MRTRDEIAVAFYKTINADATIQGVTYLNGSNKIYKSLMRPARDLVQNPTLTIDVRTEFLEGEQAEISIALVRLRLYLNRLNNGEVDHALADRIESRLKTLLHQKQLTGASGATYKQCLKLGEATFLFDPAAPEEAVYLNDFRLWTI